ncbi:MAG: hypothetical protein MZW92_55630 [Comamonadaceae bacterium]|nr:hypothetical protein [Comamonadaceae bacterium]
MLSARRCRAAGAAGACRAQHWRELLRLTLPNMIVWHVRRSSSRAGAELGRAAILGYAMPVFAALLGRRAVRRAPRLAASCSASPPRRWHRAAAVRTSSASWPARRWAARRMLIGAPRRGPAARTSCARTTLPAAALAVAFWMTVITTLVMTRAGRASSARAGTAAAAGRWADRLQRRADLRLRAAGVVLPGAHAAAGG